MTENDVSSKNKTSDQEKAQLEESYPLKIASKETPLKKPRSKEKQTEESPLKKRLYSNLAFTSREYPKELFPKTQYASSSTEELQPQETNLPEIQNEEETSEEEFLDLGVVASVDVPIETIENTDEIPYCPNAWQLLIGDVFLLISSIWRLYSYEQAKIMFMISTFILTDGIAHHFYKKSLLYNFFALSTPSGHMNTATFDIYLLRIGYYIGGWGLFLACAFFCIDLEMPGKISFITAAVFLADTSLYAFNQKTYLRLITSRLKTRMMKNLIADYSYPAHILFLIGTIVLFFSNIVRVTDASPKLMPFLFLIGCYINLEASFISLWGRTSFRYRFHDKPKAEDKEITTK